MTAQSRPIVARPKARGAPPEIAIGDWPEDEGQTAIANALNRNADVLEQILPHVQALAEVASGTLNVLERIKKNAFKYIVWGAVATGALWPAFGEIVSKIFAAIHNLPPGMRGPL